ncbi:class I SAM-dependent methyltransferase [Streptomyces sp. NPDC090085]|uniref:class I SAM-dependent methyltransferase n=1 Tax=Streptomyces sp. NPDC090085 TaxID=3365943 RepID=UPI0038157FFF
MDTTNTSNDTEAYSPAGSWDVYFASGRRFRPPTPSELANLEPHTGQGRRRILDIGCGTGTLTGILHASGHDVTGLDFSPEAIRQALADHPGPGYVLADADQDGPGGLGALAGPYDLIVCRLVVAFITDLHRFMRRASSLLADDGHLYVMTPIAEELPPERRSHAQTRAQIAALAASWTESSVREIEDHAHLTLSGLYRPVTGTSTRR